MKVAATLRDAAEANGRAAGWLYAAALLVPAMALLIGGKFAKLQNMAAAAGVPLNVGLTLSAESAEFALMGGWLAVTGGYCTLARGAALRVGLVVQHAAAGLLALLVAAEHGFFATTGSLLDWPMVTYTWAHFAMLERVLASEVHPGSVAGILLLAAANFWPLAVPRLRAVWRVPATARFTPSSLGGAAIAVLFLAMPLVVQPLPAMLKPLGQAPVVALLTGPWAPSAPPLQLGAAAKPTQPLIVKKGPRTRQLNVVLVVLESLRADATGPYSQRTETTPLLDRLAKSGVVVERAYTTVPHTTKSLVPIHCGIYPAITPYFEEAAVGALPSDCLAAVLQKLGWSTAYFQTSESFFEQNRQLIKNFGFSLNVDRDALKPTPFEEINYFGFEDKAMVAPALRWVDAQKAPFFLGTITLASHHPYTVPKAFAKGRKPPASLFGHYLDAVRYSDDALAELIAGFEKRGLVDNTLFVFIGDHGEAFGEHGQHQHDALVYEEALRVPMLLWGAGLKPQRVKGLRQNIDVLPTVLDVLGLDVLAGSLPGKSVLSTPGHPELFFACWHRDMCLGSLKGLRKTIWYYDKKGAEVFDLVTDPLEKRNLAAQAPGQVQSTVAAMQAWKAAVNARHAGQAHRRQAPLVTRVRPALTNPLNWQFLLPTGKPAIAIRAVQAPTAPLVIGEPTAVTVIYEVLHNLDSHWDIFVHGHSASGQFSRFDHVPADGTHPVPAWQAGEFITDRMWIRPLPGLAAGELDITLGFFQPMVAGVRMGVAGTGAIVPPDELGKILLATLQLTDPHELPPPRVPAGQLPFLQKSPLALAHNRAIVIGDGAVRIVHASSQPEQPAVGQTFDLTIGWQVTARLPRFTEMFMHLRGPGGRHQNIAQMALANTLPADKWRAGDGLVDVHRLRVPADWPPGPIEVWVGLWGPNVVPPGGRLAVAGPADQVDREARRAVVAKLTAVAGPPPGAPVGVWPLAPPKARGKGK